MPLDGGQCYVAVRVQRIHPGPFVHRYAGTRGLGVAILCFLICGALRWDMKAKCVFHRHLFVLMVNVRFNWFHE